MIQILIACIPSILAGVILWVFLYVDARNSKHDAELLERILIALTDLSQKYNELEKEIERLKK